MDLETLKRLLQKSWTQESACGLWDPKQKSLNQCEPTILLVQDELGGRILERKISSGETLFYLNELPDGSLVDLCRHDIEITIKLHVLGMSACDRETLLQDEEIKTRYEVLKKNFETNKAQFSTPVI